MKEIADEGRVIRRTFIIEGLPDAIKPSDEHLQVFENYVRGTRLRLRSLRRPSDDERQRFMETVSYPENGVTEISQLALDKDDYAAMKPMRGREIRKNLYRYESHGTVFQIEVFLGALWGLNLASVRFADETAASVFDPPEWCLLEVTGNTRFYGPELVDLTFEDVRIEYAKAKGEGS